MVFICIGYADASQKPLADINTRTVNAILAPDATPPIITLNGDANITLIEGDVYEELGATATDDVDGSVSVSISGSVDTSIVGTYTITYSATDVAGNGASMSRIVNVEEKVNKIKTLTLSSTQAHFIRKREAYNDKYYFEAVYTPLKVMAVYDDGQSEEVSDRVTWNSSSKTIKFNGSNVRFIKKGDYSFTASLDSVTSNSISIKIEDEDVASKLLKVSMKDHYERGYPDENIYTKKVFVEIKLLQKPTSDVVLKLKLKEKDNLSFPVYNAQNTYNTHLTQELRFTPEDWNKHRNTTIYFDINSTDDYTIITEALESEDTYYDGKDLGSLHQSSGVTHSLTQTEK